MTKNEDLVGHSDISEIISSVTELNKNIDKLDVILAKVNNDLDDDIKQLNLKLLKLKQLYTAKSIRKMQKNIYDL